eukprot:jgi/Picsp_1/2406/NSC_05867-R1_synaptic vesicle 2-related
MGGEFAVAAEERSVVYQASFDMEGSHRTVTSVNGALNRIGMGKAHWLLLGYTSFAWAADACETMILSFLGPSVACTWPDQVGPVEESILTSIVFAGMLVGVYALGAVSDSWGRRKGFVVSALLLGAAGMASAFAPTFVWLVLFRMLVGAALGGTPIAITLFAEWVPSARRGSLVLLMQSAWTVGTALEAALAWIVLSTLGWRWLLALSSVPLFVLVFGYPWLPESPYWLVAKHKFEEAEHLVTNIAKYNKIESPFEVNFRPQEASTHEPNSSCMPGTDDANGIDSRSSFVMEVKAAGTRMTFAVVDTLRKVFSNRLALTTGLLWLIWFANATTYYGLVLLTTSLQASDGKDGKSRCTEEGEAAFTSSSYTAIFITALAEAPGLLVAALLIDSKGRVWCLRAGMALCSIAIFSLLFNGGKVLQLILLFVSRAAIEGTFSVLYVYTPELYPTTIRSFGLALCNGFARLGGFTAPFATVYLVESGETMWSVIALGMLCLLATVATLLLPIETMGLDLQIPENSETCEIKQHEQEEAPLMMSNGEQSDQHRISNET